MLQWVKSLQGCRDPNRRRFWRILPQNDVVLVQKCIAPKRRYFFEPKQCRFGAKHVKNEIVLDPCNLAGT